MQDTPRGSRLHIALFGRRNAGKSSLINALTGQELAVVSGIPGTTTDPVFKAMEILPLGPVVLIDTAGIDDEGELGRLRVKKSMEVLRKTDLAVLVLDPAEGVGVHELELKRRLIEQGLPMVAVLNKIDRGGLERLPHLEEALGQKIIPVSAKTRLGIEELKGELIKAAPSSFEAPHLVGDLLGPGDTAILVVPIDSAAPKGRLILPQVQVLRDILDNDAMGLVVKEGGLKEALTRIPRPKMVITDSQVFAKAAAETPRGVWLTSFSILMARYKGDLVELVRGAKGIKGLKPGDRVLIAEACTHHPQADDIGRVQIPGWLQRYVGGALDITWVSGGSFPEDLASYKLIVHCGGCMINRREMLYRLQVARAAGVPMVNYGVLLALAHGTLDRALEPFPAAKKEWEEG
ncbi:MAG TPA: [FeFe] hydrogenase H-cluster maturation GTPase HydF [Peptococcaceae bacterium]|nr:[FeFe] hydrogenase H-cluster maturation GTPase HydF [Peptococcaceae bacterium]